MAHEPFLFYQGSLSRPCLLLTTIFPSVLVLSQRYMSHTKEFVSESKLLLPEELTWYISHFMYLLSYSHEIHELMAVQINVFGSFVARS